MKDKKTKVRNNGSQERYKTFI